MSQEFETGRAPGTGRQSASGHRPGAGTVTESGTGLTVGRTADLVGVSVRTLHHWDDIGLVSPSERTWAGYRVYSGADIGRLQQVLVYREIGMPLARIAEVLDDPDADVTDHLARQRTLLTARIARLQELVSAVDHMLEAREMNAELTPEEQARSFGSEWNDPYHDEAEQRWGDTPEWVQSQERKKSMTREDWERAGRENEELEAAFAGAKRAGVEPGSESANQLAERHRAAIGQWFDVSHQKQVLMACMYVEDPRFTAHY